MRAFLSHISTTSSRANAFYPWKPPMWSSDAWTWIFSILLLPTNCGITILIAKVVNVARTANPASTRDARLKRLAQNIEALADKDERILRRTREIAETEARFQFVD